MSIVHAILCAVLLLLGFWALWHQGRPETVKQTDGVFLYIVPVLAIAAYFACQYLYHSRFTQSNPRPPLKTRVQRYRGTTLLTYTLLALPILLALVAYALNGNALHLMIAICVFGYLALRRPSLKKLKRDLPLDLEEEKEIDTLNQ